MLFIKGLVDLLHEILLNALQKASLGTSVVRAFHDGTLLQEHPVRLDVRMARRVPKTLPLDFGLFYDVGVARPQFKTALKLPTLAVARNLTTQVLEIWKSE